MRTLFIAFFCFSSNLIYAQTIEKFYNWDWKPCDSYSASFYSNIRKTDSGWRRTDAYLLNQKIQMVGLYKDSSCIIRNGTFYYGYPNGTLSSSGDYKDNLRQGVFMSYYSNGMKKDSGVYNNGSLLGTSLSWYRNGSLADSISEGENNLYEEKSWFENGNIASVGNLFNNKEQGTWRFYDVNGNLSSIEEYDMGQVINREYFDTSGKAITDTTNTDTDAMFIGGNKAWEKYLQKRVNWPDNYTFSNGDHATVVITMLINEKGEIAYAEITVPLFPIFDSAALEAIKKSPAWEPAKKHNRFVESWFKQSITFYQNSPYILVCPNI